MRYNDLIFRRPEGTRIGAAGASQLQVARRQVMGESATFLTLDDGPGHVSTYLQWRCN